MPDFFLNPGINMWYADRLNLAQMRRSDFTHHTTPQGCAPQGILLVIAWQEAHVLMTINGGYKEDVVVCLLCQ